MAHKSKLVEEQINKLLEAQTWDLTRKPQHSPIINQMQNIKSNEKKVQKLKKIFEEKEFEEERKLFVNKRG
jgi:hypothetical protein